MKKELLVGLGCVVLLGAGLFVAAKFIRAKLALLPRGDAHGYLQVGNLKRAYDLHVPSSYNSQKPIPLEKATVYTQVLWLASETFSPPCIPQFWGTLKLRFPPKLGG